MPDVSDYALGAMAFSFGIVIGILLGILSGNGMLISFGIITTLTGWRLMRVTERKHQ